MLDLSDGWDLGDVEWVWATVAACYSKKQVHAWVTQTMTSHKTDLGCFSFEAVSDCNGRGEYPRGIMKILMRVLRPMGVAAKNPGQDVFYIQTPVWYHLTTAALGWCPPELVPAHLRDTKFALDLGI